MCYILNPTDPDAGTNRTNAVSRNNLMEGAGLGYNGSYNATSLGHVGARGYYWSTTIYNSSNSRNIRVDYSNGGIYPQNSSTKYDGSVVR
ncbi:hypothetical protein IKE88_02130 [Candidatus Saccharibacteria bacterium]|nr:hypothetical protein [Candidatus Saccharibacteria bacterium]